MFARAIVCKSVRARVQARLCAHSGQLRFLSASWGNVSGNGVECSAEGRETICDWDEHEVLFTCATLCGAMRTAVSSRGGRGSRTETERLEQGSQLDGIGAVSRQARRRRRQTHQLHTMRAIKRDTWIVYAVVQDCARASATERKRVCSAAAQAEGKAPRCHLSVSYLWYAEPMQMLAPEGNQRIVQPATGRRHDTPQPAEDGRGDAERRRRAE